MTGRHGARVQSWVERAACKGADPETFHHPSHAVLQQAKKVCLDCPVQMQCLNDALVRGDQFGVWGGMEPEERRRLMQRVRVGRAVSGVRVA